MGAKRTRWFLTLTFLSLILLVTVVLAIGIGTSWINPLPFLKLIGSKAFALDNTTAIIVFQIRLPRVLLACLIGASLALAGVVFQAILRNPLGSPFILGTSSGAAFGATLAFSLGLEIGGGIFNPVSVLAIGGALFSVFLVINISRVSGKFPTFTLILTGVMISSFFSAASMLIISLSRPDRVHRITIWLMGQIESVSYGSILFILLSLIGCFLVLMFFATALNALQMGEENAIWLGINAERVKIIVFIAASVLTGVSVTVSGLVGFVGLMIPHLVRLIFGPDHRLLLPASAICGAIFLVVTDTLARTVILPAELPVGVITAILGVPFFLFLLRRKRKLVLF